MPPGPAAPPPPPHPSPGAEPTPLGQQRLPGPCPPSARPHPVTRRQRGRTPLEAPPSPSPLHPVPNPAGSGTPLAPLLCTGVSQRSKDEEAAIKLGGKQVWLDSGLGTRTLGRPPPRHPAHGGFISGWRSQRRPRPQRGSGSPGGDFVLAGGSSQAPGPAGWVPCSPRRALPCVVTPRGSPPRYSLTTPGSMGILYPPAPCGSLGSKTGSRFNHTPELHAEVAPAPWGTGASWASSQAFTPTRAAAGNTSLPQDRSQSSVTLPRRPARKSRRNS